MADFQLHEQVTTVRFADGTAEQWRVFIDPDSGREVDRHPVVCCRDCGEELRSSCTPWDADDPIATHGIDPRGD